MYAFSDDAEDKQVKCVDSETVGLVYLSLSDNLMSNI